MAIVQQTDGGLDHVAAMEMVRSGQTPDIAIDSLSIELTFISKKSIIHCDLSFPFL